MRHASPARWPSSPAWPAPLVWLLNVSTVPVLGLLGLRPGFERHVTDEDILGVIIEGEKSGLIHAAEREMIEDVLDLTDRAVRTIMTPRPDIVWIDLDASPDAVVEAIERCPYAQLLVCRGSLDNFIGVVRKQDLLGQALAGTALDIEKALHAPLPIPERTSIFRTLDLFRKTPVNTAVVVDEYGTVQGIVTRTDLLEAVAGRLPDVDSKPDGKLRRRDDGSIDIDAATPDLGCRRYAGPGGSARQGRGDRRRPGALPSRPRAAHGRASALAGAGVSRSPRWTVPGSRGSSLARSGRRPERE